MKHLAILGSTGSIGVTTLDVVGRFPDRFRITALAGGRNVERLAEQVKAFRPRAIRGAALPMYSFVVLFSTAGTR